MLRPIINFLICQVCDPCESRLVCNTRAIVKLDPAEPPYIAVERCTGCAACVLACACSAIQMHNAGSAVGAGCRGINI
jgi:Pyruvate/2-oxoacid:ferredoxin oxidoreductase delta subunit